MNRQKEIADTLAQIQELQLWFAHKPFGYTERCTAEQLKQYREREYEESRLCRRLAYLQDEA